MVRGTDMGHSQIRVYNYNTSEKITSFEAHPDYIRAIVVHPTQPFVLTASDDMTIKLWDWEKGWKNVRVFEGNSRMSATTWTVPRRNADSAPRLCYVPGHQPQGHKYLRLSLLGQDRSEPSSAHLVSSLTPEQSRYGAWGPLLPISNWKHMRPRASTMWITTPTATSRISLPPQTT
jgi:WD40 repeat protein